MGSEFLRLAKNRRHHPAAVAVILRLKEVAASWDKEADDLSDEEAFRILQTKTWISLQRDRDDEEAIQDISPLADFVTVTDLFLSNHAISSISPLAGLTKIRRLVVRNNRITDLGPLRQMHELADLDVRDNPIADFSALAVLPALRELEMSAEQLASFASAGSIGALWSLRINEPCDDLSLLPEMPDLRVLHLGACASLEGIQRFTELRNVHVGTGELGDLTPLSALTKLTSLNICENRVASLVPLGRCFALRELWALRNRIGSVEPLGRLPVLHEIHLSDNPISPAEIEAFEKTLSLWDEEFLETSPHVQPALVLEIVDQETWDYYDEHPFNRSDSDGDEALFGNEKTWLLDRIEAALELDWCKDDDFAVPWRSSRGRSHTVCLMSGEAAASFRSIATHIQQALCSARNEYIIYLQTDHCDDDVPNYIVWVYRDRIVVTPETAPVITDLL